VPVLVDPASSLDDLLTARDGMLAVPDTWQLGRGAFGGLVTGAMIRALEASATDRPLRSFTAELCGPVQPGDATLELSLLRAGNAVTTTAIRVIQGGEILAHGVGVLGRPRRFDVDHTELAAPALPPWRDVPIAQIDPSAGPPFAQHFQYRVVGAAPFTREALSSEIVGWVCPKRPGKRRDSAFLAACIDAYWPTAFAVSGMRPMATIAFTFQPMSHAELDPDTPLAYRGRLMAIDRGYCVEQRELWAQDGRLLALNQQTFVIIA
jgi:acyl-CoA thioesterase